MTLPWWSFDAESDLAAERSAAPPTPPAPDAVEALDPIVVFADVCDQRGYADERVVSIGVWDGGTLPEFNAIMRLTVGDIRAMRSSLAASRAPGGREVQ